MSTSPLVSIITPVYNYGGYIGKAIRSVLLQTYKNWEMIVIDDGSTDETEKTVNNFQDKRIIYIKKEHSGISQTRNVGLSHARGDYIAFLDADDVWLPEKLSIQMECIQKSGPGVGLIHSDGYVLQDGKVIVQHRKKPILEQIGRSSFLLAGIMPSCVLIRRDCLNHEHVFDEKLNALEDYDLWLRIAQKYKFVYIDKPLFVYLMHQGQAHKNKIIKIQSREYVYQKYRSIIKGRNDIYSRMYFKNGHELCESGEILKGRSYLIKAIKTGPFSSKYIYAYVLSLFGSQAYRYFFLLKRYISSHFFAQIHPDNCQVVQFYKELGK